MAFDIPRDVLLPVDVVDVRLSSAPHPFETVNADAIEANWRTEKQAIPALFNGEVVLLSSLSLAGRRIEGICHAIRYATFLYWRRRRPHAGAEHAFAHAALVSRDNALVAIRMGTQTANPGRVYFAAGSFEPSDFPQGCADLHFNMAREVREETGIEIKDAARDDGHLVLSTASGTALFRRYYLDADAVEIADEIARFVAADAAPEIEGPVIIRGPGDLPAGIMAHMAPIVEWHFSGPGRPKETIECSPESI